MKTKLQKALSAYNKAQVDLEMEILEEFPIGTRVSCRWDAHRMGVVAGLSPLYSDCIVVEGIVGHCRINSLRKLITE